MTTKTAFSLSAEARTITGRKVASLRREGLVPAVTYGHNKKTEIISVPSKEFMKIYKQAGQSSLIDLTIGDNKPVKVLIQEVQIDAVKAMCISADFYIVNLKEKLRTNVSLKFVGTSEAVEVLGGNFITAKDEVEIECLPDNLIPEIEVDISSLKTFEDSLYVKDLIVKEGVEILDDGDDLIAAITPPRSEEELADLDTVVEANVEVESETKSGTDTPEAPAEEK